MISDLLEVTDANILLIIGDDQLDSIGDLLKSNNYHKTQKATDAKTALAFYQKARPDLIIFGPAHGCTLDKLSTHLQDLNPNTALPPIFLINSEQAHIPPINAGAKDFINSPVNSEEFLYRLHHLILNELSSQESAGYTKTILETIQQRNNELQESQLEIIECLGYATEFRDSETGMHTIRVGHYSVCLAKAMGMNDREAEKLLYSAPMHDVGKIGIPDAILLKPSRLEDKEWEIMKQHTLIGEQILNRSKNKLLQQASLIALSHHEKWDGSGYPNGLSGTNIHLYGRIVAIVDVFDALTMERPYKKAWSIENALALINAESGKHFDPSLVELFNEFLPEIIKIKDTYKDDYASATLLNEYVSIS
ncbi:MAG: HD domain-containing protein [Methyloprofundus sp.]|nr:HD domain-containing protein [Methyloprofundus sp.]